MKKDKKLKNISRIDSKNTHGWYVRIYLNGSIFTAKLFSDRVCGNKERALKYAILYRDHNLVVAELSRSKHNVKHTRKPFLNKPSRNNSSGIVGVNEVRTSINGKSIHYIQATWSENGSAFSKKFYINSKRTKKEAIKQAINLRKQKETVLLKNYLLAE